MAESNLTKILNRLSDIFILLTGQPAPEQEEEAQKELVPLIKSLVEKGNRDDLKKDAEDLFQIVSKWDTLEKWFAEVNGLSEKMQYVLLNYGMGGDAIEKTADNGSKPNTKEAPLSSTEKSVESSSTKETSQAPTGMKRGDSETIEEYEKRIKTMEARMQELEEKNKKLVELEKKLMQSKEPSEAPKVELRSKLAPPKIHFPPVVPPKKLMQVTPVEPAAAPVSNPFEPIPESTEPQNTTSEPTQENVPEQAPNIAPENSPEEIPRIRVVTASSAIPIKIQPTPIRIQMPIAETAPEDTPVMTPVSRPQIKTVGSPVIKPVNNDQSPVIKPVGFPSIKPIGGSQIPMIKPVGSPEIKPVGAPAIRRVSDIGSPAIKPVSDAVIKPIGAPAIRPVGNTDAPVMKLAGNAPFKPIGVPSIRPVGGTGLPAIKPTGAAPVKPMFGSGSNIVPITNASAIPQPAKAPMNLFDQQVGQKKAVNLFDQSGSQKGKRPDPNAGDAGAPGGPVQKVSGLDHIDFNAQPSGVASDQSTEFASLSSADLYQNLIRLEAKSFFYDKQLKESEVTFQKGQINEAEFRGTRERFTFEMDNANKKIKDIRGFILGLKS